MMSSEQIATFSFALCTCKIYNNARVKQMALSRNQTHLVIMTVIYNELEDYYFGDKTFTRDVKEMITEMVGEPYEQIDQFIKDMVFVSLQRYGEIVTAFTPYLKNWKWERLPLLTQAILVMSYTHFYYVEKPGKKIVINIAVDLAKKYVDDEQAKFINGILDKGVFK